MYVLLTTVFVASLLGSLHCVGMCGPFALIAAGTAQRPSVAPTFAYSFGRLLTYLVVGTVFGAVGMAINSITSMRGDSIAFWQQSATLLAGVLMVIVGAIALARHFGLRIRLPRFASPLQSLVQASFQRVKGLPPVARAGAIGALTSLMPCGWLYTFALTAAGTGSPWWGALLMFVFWAGTVPILTVLMLGASRIQFSLSSAVPVVMALLAIGVGVYTITFRASISLAGMQARSSNLDALTSEIQSVDHDSLPCCNCESEGTTQTPTRDDREARLEPVVQADGVTDSK